MGRIRMFLLLGAVTATLAACANPGTVQSPYSAAPAPYYGPPDSCGALGNCPPNPNYPRLGPHDGALGF